ncbi:putative protein without homology [Propionibacterium freudenreichii subsp. shermanii]|nr:putative protein without homology [Propionibacterium freudenreichii subsp. shermanii]
MALSADNGRRPGRHRAATDDQPHPHRGAVIADRPRQRAAPDPSGEM